MSRRFEFFGGDGAIQDLDNGDKDLSPEEFWEQVPERCRLALARAAPKIIPPWQPYTLRNPEEERECRADGYGFFAWFARNVEGNMPPGTKFTPGWWRYGNSGGAAVGEKPTREEARAAADALVLAEGNRVLG